MEKSFELLSSQRYYYFVAFKIDSKFDKDYFWKNCGFKLTGISKIYDYFDCLIENRKILSEEPYHLADDNDYSLKKDGFAPYVYDLFSLNLKKSGILLMGFPFISLTKRIITDLISIKSIFKEGCFIKFDLTKLIKLEKIEYSSDFYSSTFKGLDLVVSGDSELSAISLIGDNPIAGGFYQSFFKKKIEDNECIVRNCQLLFEFNNKKPEIIPLSKSNIQLDIFGNIKLYLHLSGNNIFTLQYLFEILEKYECLNTTLNNPTNKIDINKNKKETKK